MQENADNTFSSSNFLRILEHLRVRALPSRPSKLTAGFIPKPADFFPEITPTKQQISDYINLIYHFKEFLFDEVLKNKNSLLEGDFEETILQLVNQLTGEVEKEKLEFTVMDSLEQLTELEDFLQTIQNMFGLCNSEDVINDYSDTEELYTLRNFILRSGLFNTHSENFVHTEILENIERIPLTDSIRESSMFRSMTYVLTVINRFIDIALSQRLSQSEITLLINDELAEFDYQDEMWSVENPYTILDLALKEVDASSVVHELVSNKQNYYGLMRNLEFESKKEESSSNTNIDENCKQPRNKKFCVFIPIVRV